MKESTIYIADDGKQFFEKNLCETYEQEKMLIRFMRNKLQKIHDTCIPVQQQINPKLIPILAEQLFKFGFTLNNNTSEDIKSV